MSDIVAKLRDVSQEERQKTLVNLINSQRESLEKLNGGKILEVLEYGGLRVGDKVRYVNALGKQTLGYVSHFFSKTHHTGGYTLAELLVHSAAAMDQRQISVADGIFPVMIRETGYGYSTHHGVGLPTKA